MLCRRRVRTATIAAVIAVAAQGGGIRAAGADPDRWDRPLSDLRDPALGIRRAAAESLVEIALETGREKRTPARDEVLKRHLRTIAEIVRDKKEDPGVRALLARAIGIGEFGPLARDTAPSLIDVLIDETDHEEVRGWCAMTLPDIGPPDKVGPAIIAASHSRNTNVRVNASQALCQVSMGPEQLLPWLDRAIVDPVPQVRVTAVTIAGGLLREKDKRALPILLRAINDKDTMVQRAALSDLQESGDKAADAKGRLVGLLEDPDPAIRVNAAAALMKITGDTAKYIAIPIEALHSKEPSARAAAAVALCLFGPEGERAVPALTQVLHDPDAKVRVQAAFALTNITGKADDYLPVLIEGLASKNLEARMWASGALGFVVPQARSATRSLLEVVKHEDPFVRGMALSLLGALKLDRAAALRLFSDALDDPSPEVRMAALQALGSMGRDAQDALPAVQKAALDPNDNVRQIAGQAVRQIEGKD